jgi:periplasmic divalent cation tolerance protein
MDDSAVIDGRGPADDPARLPAREHYGTCPWHDHWDAGQAGRAAGRAYDQAMPARRAAADPQFLQVQTTTDSRAEAVELAHAAVAARLAACAQVAGPIASTYWWEEGIERAEEWLIMLKLPAGRYDDLAAFLAERHSYDEPEIIATPIVAGSPGYLDWLEDETRPQ